MKSQRWQHGYDEGLKAVTVDPESLTYSFPPPQYPSCAEWCMGYYAGINATLLQAHQESAGGHHG